MSAKSSCINKKCINNNNNNKEELSLKNTKNDTIFNQYIKNYKNSEDFLDYNSNNKHENFNNNIEITNISLNETCEKNKKSIKSKLYNKNCCNHKNINYISKNLENQGLLIQSLNNKDSNDSNNKQIDGKQHLHDDNNCTNKNFLNKCFNFKVKNNNVFTYNNSIANNNQYSNSFSFTNSKDFADKKDYNKLFASSDDEKTFVRSFSWHYIIKKSSSRSTKVSNAFENSYNNKNVDNNLIYNNYNKQHNTNFYETKSKNKATSLEVKNDSYFDNSNNSNRKKTNRSLDNKENCINSKKNKKLSSLSEIEKVKDIEKSNIYMNKDNNKIDIKNNSTESKEISSLKATIESKEKSKIKSKNNNSNSNNNSSEENKIHKDISFINKNFSSLMDNISSSFLQSQSSCMLNSFYKENKIKDVYISPIIILKRSQSINIARKNKNNIAKDVARLNKRNNYVNYYTKNLKSDNKSSNTSLYINELALKYCYNNPNYTSIVNNFNSSSSYNGNNSNKNDSSNSNSGGNKIIDKPKISIKSVINKANINQVYNTIKLNDDKKIIDETYNNILKCKNSNRKSSFSNVNNNSLKNNNINLLSKTKKESYNKKTNKNIRSNSIKELPNQISTVTNCEIDEQDNTRKKEKSQMINRDQWINAIAKAKLQDAKDESIPSDIYSDSKLYSNDNFNNKSNNNNSSKSNNVIAFENLLVNNVKKNNCKIISDEKIEYNINKKLVGDNTKNALNKFSNKSPNICTIKKINEEEQNYFNNLANNNSNNIFSLRNQSSNSNGSPSKDFNNTSNYKIASKTNKVKKLQKNSSIVENTTVEKQIIDNCNMLINESNSNNNFINYFDCYNSFSINNNSLLSNTKSNYNLYENIINYNKYLNNKCIDNIKLESNCNNLNGNISAKNINKNIVINDNNLELKSSSIVNYGKSDYNYNNYITNNKNFGKKEYNILNKINNKDKDIAKSKVSEINFEIVKDSHIDNSTFTLNSNNKQTNEFKKNNINDNNNNNYSNNYLKKERINFSINNLNQNTNAGLNNILYEPNINKDIKSINLKQYNDNFYNSSSSGDYKFQDKIQVNEYTKNISFKFVQIATTHKGSIFLQKLLLRINDEVLNLVYKDVSIFIIK